MIKAIELTPDDVTALGFVTNFTEGMPESFDYEMLYLNRAPIGAHEIAYAVRTKMCTTRVGMKLNWTSGPLQLAYVRKIKSNDAAFATFAQKASRITGIANSFAPTETKLLSKGGSSSIPA